MPSNRDAAAPTAEERASEFFDHACFRDALPGTYEKLVESFRAAVAAERERCANIDPYSVPCPICECIGDPCIYVNPHPERIAAAIRAEPDDGGSEQ